MKLHRVLPLALSLALLPTLVYGSQVALPHLFTNGDLADADDVNANFSALADAVNDNDGRLSRMEGSAVIRVPHTPGDDLASGQALRDAVASIPTDASIDSYVICLEPGTYELQFFALLLPDGVTLRGAGRERTVVHSSASDTLDLANGARVAISHLTVRSRPSGIARGVVGTTGAADLVLRHVRIDVVGSPGATGIATFGGVVDMADTEIRVVATNAGTSPLGLEVGGIGNGGAPATVTACHCCISVSAGGMGMPRGVRLRKGTVVLRGTKVVTPGGEGLLIDGAGQPDARIQCHECSVSAATAMTAIASQTGIDAACSQVEGALVGAVTLVHCYDASFAAIP